MTKTTTKLSEDRLISGLSQAAEFYVTEVTDYTGTAHASISVALYFHCSN